MNAISASKRADNEPPAAYNGAARIAVEGQALDEMFFVADSSTKLLLPAGLPPEAQRVRVLGDARRLVLHSRRDEPGRLGVR
ncbi:MAG TPA: hypothetical protein VM243_13170 [Phycisphaerae bacterium]|nr:hypothetical protein [Phycisphaerae bacterium]